MNPPLLFSSPSPPSPPPRPTFLPFPPSTCMLLFLYIYIHLYPSSSLLGWLPPLGFLRHALRARMRSDKEGGWSHARGPPLFHSGLLCRTRSFECGFLHVFVSEARNSVCPLQLPPNQAYSTLLLLPLQRAKRGPLAGTRGVIPAYPACAHVRSTVRRIYPVLYTHVVHACRASLFIPPQLSLAATTELLVAQACLQTRRYALSRSRVIGRRSSGSKSSRDPPRDTHTFSLHPTRSTIARTKNRVGRRGAHGDFQ